MIEPADLRAAYERVRDFAHVHFPADGDGEEQFAEGGWEAFARLCRYLDLSPEAITFLTDHLEAEGSPGELKGFLVALLARQSASETEGDPDGQGQAP